MLFGGVTGGVFLPIMAIGTLVSVLIGEVLHVRYSTYDSTQTLQEILAIVGEQEVTEIAVDKA